MATTQLENRIRIKATNLHQKKIFPAYVSGAEYRSFRKVGLSGGISEGEFVSALKNELIQFGELGSKYNKSSIGYCAETVSANMVLKRFPNKLKSINVGKAIRPKTLQVGKKCSICNSLF